MEKDLKAKLKAAWDKVVAGVKSAPAVFGYGVIVGLVSGLLIGG